MSRVEGLHAGLIVTVERRHRAGALAEAEVVAGGVGEPGAHPVEVYPDRVPFTRVDANASATINLKVGIRPTVHVGGEVPDVLGRGNGATAVSRSQPHSLSR